MTMGTFPGYANVLGGVVSFLSDLGSFVLSLGRGGAIDLRGKVSLLDNDELLLVWEPELRTIRIKKEEEAWYSFEAQYGRGSPMVTDAFVAWQEKLYAYIEQEKDRFLQRRRGSIEGREKLLRAGARTVVVTKGAKPYTQKCFDLTGLSPFVSEIYSPPPGKRRKRFGDAVLAHGVRNPVQCARDVVIVGHDIEKDMAWDIVPARDNPAGDPAPVFVLFDTFKYNKPVKAPLDALPEIIELLARKGKNDFLRGFRVLALRGGGKTRNYVFSTTYFEDPKRRDKVRIPIIYDIRGRE